MVKPIDWKNIQGLVRYGYLNQMHARYELLSIENPTKAKAWLKSILDNVSMADVNTLPHSSSGQNFHFNIAITHKGLSEFGVQEGALASFAAEFREGMVGKSRTPPTSRSAKLGDIDENGPDLWQWGGSQPDAEQIHILLMVFANNKVDEDDAFNNHLVKTGYTSHGLSLIKTLHGELDKNNPVEHFGFRDGISQPIIEERQVTREISSMNKAISVVKPGEFILGYVNERDTISESPIVTARDHGNDTLPVRSAGKWDLGKNGSYLVFRQLRQDVRMFEQYLEDRYHEQPMAMNIQNHSWKRRNKEEWKNWLAAKMVGRWRNGMPLTQYPDDDSTDFVADKANEFFFADNDQEGLRCPIGAHIRRANPRDSLDKDPAHALQVSKHQRIIRRGRIYGNKHDESAPDDGKGPNERGLLFICLNASIAGQFESIQHDWLNSPQFGELYEETDPLLGTRSKAKQMFSVPARPSNLRFPMLGQFVTVSGGAYFFLPGKQALNWLAHI